MPDSFRHGKCDYDMFFVTLRQEQLSVGYMEIIIKIDRRSKQAQAVIDMLKTFDFVKFVGGEEEVPVEKKVPAELGADYSKEQFVAAISKKVNKAIAKKWYEKSGIAY
ncbi:MAG: hypothetical protein QM640_00070 [Niabella sp.]